jgi:hypothetical protein
MTTNDRDNARISEISTLLNRGDNLPCEEGRWLLYTFWRTRSELDYARGRIEAYQKVEAWMNQP